MRNPFRDEHRNTELSLSAATRAKSTGAAAGRQWVEIRGYRVEQPMLVDDLRQADEQRHERRHNLIWVVRRKVHRRELHQRPEQTPRSTCPTAQ